MSRTAQVRLDGEQLEQLAQRVAGLLADRLQPAAPPPPRRAARELMTAAQVAQWWRLDRSWVYDHADQLGVIKLGTDSRPRLRFDPDHVAHALGLPAPDETGPVSESTVIPSGRTQSVPNRRNQSYGRRTP
jgi:hypothetical protein